MSEEAIPLLDTATHDAIEVLEETACALRNDCDVSDEIFRLNENDDIQTVLLQTKKHRAELCARGPILPEGKKAHLFVSHSSYDSDEVLIIVADLERIGVGCILADRDFEPGKKVLDNIEHGIKKAAKVLLFMSSNFLRSKYCMHELDLAFSENSKNCIVPVLLEECEVPRKFKTLTYIDAAKDKQRLSHRIMEAFNNLDTYQETESHMGIGNQLDPSMMSLYFKVLKEGTEKKNTIRVMVVGHHGVGKTTLTKNLLGMSLDGTTSTNGIDVHVHKCIASSDGKWIIKESPPTDSESITRIANVARSVKAPKPDFDQSSSALVNSEETKVKSVETDKEMENVNDDSIILETTNQTANMSRENVLQFASIIEDSNSSETANIIQNKAINIWDFGGQFIFYATHQLFHSPRAVYLLVLDLSKSILTIVQDDDECPFRSNFKDVKSFCQFWMHSIHSYVGSLDGEPPVILVGTHLDMFEGDDKAKTKRTFDYFEDVRKLFDGTPVLKHIQPEQFAFNNFAKDSKSIQDLIKCIINIAEKQKNWNQEIPVKWIPLEISMRERRNEKHVMFDEVCKINATNDVPIEDRNEITLFLLYHHLMGTLIYFNEDALSDFVVLDPQWLIDAFRCIITSKEFCTVRSELRHLWDKLETEAILDPKLIDDVWSSDNTNNDFYEHKDILLKYLDKLNIISKVCVYNDETVVQTNTYIVPCLLKSRFSQNDIEAFLGSRKKKSTMTALAFAVENVFVLPTLFHRTTAAAMKRWPIVEYKGNKLLYENIGIYRLDDAHCGVIELTDKAIEVRVVNLCGLEIDCQQSDILRRFVELMLTQELERCHRNRKSRYRLGIRCCLESEQRGNCIKYIDDLKQCKPTTPCPDLEHEHVLDVKLILREWFPDDYIQGPNQDWFFHGISSDTLSRKVTTKNLDKIAKAIGCDWECLAKSLGLSKADVFHIKEDSRYSSVYQIYLMLTKWVEQNADGATLAVLLQKMKDNPAVQVEWDQIKNMLDEF